MIVVDKPAIVVGCLLRGQLVQQLPQQRQPFPHVPAEGDGQGQLHDPAPVPATHLGRCNPHLIHQHMRESGRRCPTTHRLRKQGLETRLRTPPPPALVKDDRHDGREVVLGRPVGGLPLPDAEAVPQHPQRHQPLHVRLVFHEHVQQQPFPAIVLNIKQGIHGAVPHLLVHEGLVAEGQRGPVDPGGQVVGEPGLQPGRGGDLHLHGLQEQGVVVRGDLAAGRHARFLVAGNSTRGTHGRPWFQQRPTRCRISAFPVETN